VQTAFVKGVRNLEKPLRAFVQNVKALLMMKFIRWENDEIRNGVKEELDSVHDACKALAASFAAAFPSSNAAAAASAAAGDDSMAGDDDRASVIRSLGEGMESCGERAATSEMALKQLLVPPPRARKGGASSGAGRGGAGAGRGGGGT
jgi:hypothetical protein